jgi:hypothetical protein
MQWVELKITILVLRQYLGPLSERLFKANTRTSRINALRGLCREFGIAIPLGACTGVEAISRALAC